MEKSKAHEDRCYADKFLAKEFPADLNAWIKGDYLGLVHDILMGGSQDRARSTVMKMDEIIETPQEQRQGNLKSVIIGLKKNES